MKNKNPRGLFDEQDRLEALSRQSDPLVKLASCIHWEQFRPLLDACFCVEEKDKRKGGRPPFDYVMMFKVLVLQRYYNLSDGQTQFQILDRLCFMRFLGLQLSDRVPDEKTIWVFRNRLTECGCLEEIFGVFLGCLEQAGLVAHEGKIVDASFVEAPKQRNKREENEQVKGGEVPREWLEKPNKLRQKDVDARWTKKDNKVYYGYKNHVKADGASKLITKFVVTDAAVHDSQALADLLDKQEDGGQDLHADSAYTGAEQEKTVAEAGMTNRVNEKGQRNKPLDDAQKASNREKSTVRARVEHIFGYLENSMNGLGIRCIGMVRARGAICLANLTYNMMRAIQLIKGHKTLRMV